MGSARHVIERIVNPRFLSDMASYDVASTFHQSLIRGDDVRTFEGRWQLLVKSAPDPSDVLWVGTRGLHSTTSQLNLSRFCH